MPHITVCVNHFAQKPKDPEIIKSLQSTGNYFCRDITIDEFASYIGKGHPFRGANHLINAFTFKEANAVTSSIIALDFDHVADSPEHYIDYARTLGIEPNLWYYSYSHGKEPDKYNFRLVWVFKEEIGVKQIRPLTECLMRMFKFADPACKNVSRLWFATDKPVTVLNSDPSSIGSIGWLDVCAKVKEGAVPSKVLRAKTGPVSAYTEFTPPTPDFKIPASLDWKSQLRPLCPLWQKWQDQEYLDYNQRLTLFVNLSFLEYQDHKKSVFDDVVTYFDESKWEGHTLCEQQIKNCMSASSLIAIPIVYTNDGRMTVSEYLSALMKDGIPNTRPRIELSELDARMAAEVPAYLEDDRNHIIKCQTAGGKTTLFVDWCAKTVHKKIVYVAPNYKLLNETKQKLLAAHGIEMMIPRKSEIDNGLKEIRVKLGMGAGANTERTAVINRMLDPNVEGVFGITHALYCRKLLKGANIDRVIIDEDVDAALINSVELIRDDLFKLMPFVRPEYLEAALSDFDRGEFLHIQDMVRHIDYTRYIDALQSDSRCMVDGIYSLKEGKWDYCKIGDRMYFEKVSDAPMQGIPTKMLTATPLTRENDLFLADYDEITFPLAKNRGQIVQYLGCSGAKCSSDDLKDYILSKIPPEELDKAYCLTFKSLTHDASWRSCFRFPEIDGDTLHLANNAGIDMLKGATVIVAGKFDYPEEWYTRIYRMRLHKSGDPTRNNHTLTINGMKVMMYVWDDPDLRKIQLEQINRFIEQAAGRARALRELGAKVYVFANYPIEDADIYYEV